MKAAFDESGHPFGHDDGQLVAATQMIVGDVGDDGLAKSLDVLAKFSRIDLEQRVLHHHKAVFTLDDKRGIGHHIVAVVNMQAESIQFVRLKLTCCLLCIIHFEKFNYLI